MNTMSILPLFSGWNCNAILLRNLPAQVTSQFVRWRKPGRLNLPKAKSKVFRVRLRTIVEPKEREKTEEWFRHYNTEMKSIRAFQEKAKSVSDPKVTATEQVDLEQDSWEEMVRLNTAWNVQVAEIRKMDEMRLEKQAKQRKEMVIKRDEKERQNMQLEAQQRVKDIMEMSESFIDETNVDEKIEQLLNSHTQYDYALYASGKVRDPSGFKGLKPDLQPVTRSLQDNQPDPRDKNLNSEGQSTTDHQDNSKTE